MNQAVWEALVKSAKASMVMCYEELAETVGLDMENPDHRRRIGQLLGEISKHEVRRGRPMLSAVVVHKDDRRPGKGFFELARELGLHEGYDDELFYVEELKRVFECWCRRR